MFRFVFQNSKRKNRAGDRIDWSHSHSDARACAHGCALLFDEIGEIVGTGTPAFAFAFALPFALPFAARSAATAVGRAGLLPRLNRLLVIGGLLLFAEEQ